jgi:hypothetical protein
MCVFWLKVITVSALARTARSVPCHNFHSRNTPRWNFFRDVFIDQRSRKVDPRDKAQDVPIVFGLLLFWSWYVRHSIVYNDLNQSFRLWTRNACFCLRPSPTLPRRITHGVYRILRSKARICYSYSSGSYIPQRGNRPCHPSTTSVCCFSDFQASQLIDPMRTDTMWIGRRAYTS